MPHGRGRRRPAHAGQGRRRSRGWLPCSRPASPAWRAPTAATSRVSSPERGRRAHGAALDRATPPSRTSRRRSTRPGPRLAPAGRARGTRARREPAPPGGWSPPRPLDARTRRGALPQPRGASLAGRAGAHAFPLAAAGCRGSVRRVPDLTPQLLAEITSLGKTVLLLVAITFIGWALYTAMIVPKKRPDFPRDLNLYIVVTAALFVAQMGAVIWVTGTQEVEHEASGEVGGGGEDRRRRRRPRPRRPRRRRPRPRRRRPPAAATRPRARRCSRQPAAPVATRCRMQAPPGRSAPTSTTPSRRPGSSSSASRTGWV